MAGGLGGDHPHVQIGAGHDLVVVHVETVGKSQRGAFFQVRLDFAVNACDVFIGQQNHHNIGRCDGFVDFSYLQTGLADLVPRCTALAQADHDLHAAVVQVLCMGVALRAVADDGHGLALDQAQVTVFIVENFHGRSG